MDRARLAKVMDACARWLQGWDGAARRVELVVDDVHDAEWRNGERWSYAPGVINRGAMQLDEQSFSTLKIEEERRGTPYFHWQIAHLTFRIPVKCVKQMRTYEPESTANTYELEK